MLTENALVIKSEGARALVLTHRGEACRSCSAGSACGILGGGKELRVQVLNHLRAKEGDLVELALPESSFLKVSAITYLLPLAGFTLGAIIGHVFGDSVGLPANAAAIILALGGLGLAMLAVIYLNRRLSVKEEFIPRIIRVLPPESEGAAGALTGTESC
ncbi:MAG: SoxR reducing system RseC family protein [Pseudomonadota bacterium]